MQCWKWFLAKVKLGLASQIKCSDVSGCQNSSNQFEGYKNTIMDSDSDDEGGAESDKFESDSEIKFNYRRS